MDKYEIIKVLSRKADTIVYQAVHRKLKAMRLIKQISKTSKHFKELSEEVFLMKDLKYFGIPQIYDIEEDEASLCVIEQYIEGETLQALSGRKALKEQDMLYYMIQLCDILKYLHALPRPVLYLDIKPENVMISGKDIYLVDFGSAIYADAAGSRTIFGTPGFAAPEQYSGTCRIDERADIYGIGMMLYYMVSGLRITPEQNQNIDFAGKCSKELKAVINSCIRSRQWLRYAKVEEIKRTMEKCCKKLTDHNDTQKSIFAVAGSQHRIGATHLSLMLCRHLGKAGKNVLYLENNSTGFLREYLNYSEITLQPGIHKIKGIHAGTKDRCMAVLSVGDNEIEEYECIVWDFGVLDEENIDEFMKFKNKILIMGGKEWELSKTKKALNLCLDDQAVCCIYNFLEAGRFIKAAGLIGHRRCFRMPCVPDPFAAYGEAAFVQIAEEIFGYLGVQAGTRDIPAYRKICNRLNTAISKVLPGKHK